MEENRKVKEALIRIITVQFICAVIVLITVLTVKYFFKDTYSDFKRWYAKNIENDTDISEVLGDINEI